MLFHAECGQELPQPDDTVRLWWIAVNAAEVTNWTHKVVQGGGRVVEVKERVPRPVLVGGSEANHFHADFIFECSVRLARTFGYDDASLIDSALIPEEDGAWQQRPRLNDA
jgi:hypothetical protein